MYIIRTEKTEELKQGRTLTYIANKIGLSRVYLSYVFNAKHTAEKQLIEKILKFCLNQTNVSEEDIEKYFKKI